MPKRSDIILLAATVLLCLVGLEFGYRAVSGVPFLRMTDWSKANLVTETNPFRMSDYDPVVGWVTKAGIAADWINTIEYGVRKNQQSDANVATGGILVVGDSF